MAQILVKEQSALFDAVEDPQIFERFLRLEPEPVAWADERRIDDVARALAIFTDLKSPTFLGHSTGVAALAERAAQEQHLSVEETRTLLWAALLHDLGRLSVANRVWTKPAALDWGEWERVRLHSYGGSATTGGTTTSTGGRSTGGTVSTGGAGTGGMATGGAGGAGGATSTGGNAPGGKGGATTGGAATGGTVTTGGASIGGATTGGATGTGGKGGGTSGGTAGGVGGAATGGTAGKGGTGGSGGGACQHVQLKGSDICTIGDSWIQIPGNQVTTLQNHMRTAGSIGAGENFDRREASGTRLETIIGTYNRNTSCKILIMDGGGIDLFSTPLGPDSTAVTSVVDQFKAFLAKVKADGNVEHVLYSLYPVIPNTANLNANMKPGFSAGCAASAVHCVLVDLEPLFMGQHFASDRTHADNAGGVIIGDAWWKAMKENCIGQ